MKCGTNYSVRVIDPNGLPLFECDIHLLLMRMWYSNCLPVPFFQGVSIEIERDGVRVEKRRIDWEG